MHDEGDIVVVDLDGTLCDHGHRKHLLMSQEYDAYNAACVDDSPNRKVLAAVRAFAAAGLTIVICTGRTDKYRNQTFNWLFLHNVPVNELLMRPEGNFHPDHELKPAILREWIEELVGSNVLVVLEDRDRVVRAWRDAGYECWQVQEGDF